ncbi:MAG: hypothetical protein ABI200_03730, partial [Gaiellales bacterium]
MALIAMLATVGPSHAADRSGLGCSTEAPTGVESGPAWTSQLITLVNDHRRSIGVAEVAEDATLERISTWKARDMVSRMYG